MTLALDSGKDYTSLTGLTGNNKTYYVYIKLVSASKEECLLPTSISLDKSETWPDDGNWYFLGSHILAKVTTDANGLISSITQLHIGDIKDTNIIPDSDSKYDFDYGNDGVKRNKSMAFSGGLLGARHERELNDYGWDGTDFVSDTPDATNDYLVYRHAVDGRFVKQYCSIANLAAVIGDNIDVDVWGPIIGDWLNDNTHIKHNKLDFTAGLIPAAAFSNTDHDYRYPEPDTPTNEVDANAGIFSFTNTTVASDGGGAIKVSGGIYVAKGVYVKGTGVDGAGNFITNAFYARIASATEAAYMVDGTNIVYIADGTRAINVSTGDYYHASVQGKTIANWFGGGILTGTGITARRIRTIDADTGVEVDIEVLARAT
jgi:hypothetical protein